MMQCIFGVLRASRFAFIGGMVVLSGVIPVKSLFASDATVYKVEEDWEMVVNEPDVSNNSPQITFFTSPGHGFDDSYFQLQMNYHADEAYSSGGFHVASVHQGRTVDEARSVTRKSFSTDDDVVRWTSVMAVINNQALFAIRDGYGREWGHFGGPNYLVRMVSSPVPDLSTYQYQQSLQSVDIGFGRNRISRITLKAVRLFYTDGRVELVAENQQL
ncbi:MAG: hypothetical protein OSA98_03230 [Rubripirellula sp.]|nr:hypothetical protein [Rubripirellula sp.]